jgi:hypothetical protein
VAENTARIAIVARNERRGMLQGDIVIFGFAMSTGSKPSGTGVEIYHPELVS